MNTSSISVCMLGSSLALGLAVSATDAARSRVPKYGISQRASPDVGQFESANFIDPPVSVQPSLGREPSQRTQPEGGGVAADMPVTRSLVEPGPQACRPAWPGTTCCEAKGQPGYWVDGFSGGFRVTCNALPGNEAFGPKFNLVLSYRSTSARVTPVGPGWDMAYNVTLEPNGTDWRLYEGTGRGGDLYRYDPDYAGWWNLEFPEILRAEAGGYVLDCANLAQLHFRSGFLSQITDRNGNVTNLSWSLVAPLLEKVTNAAGQDYQFGYTGLLLARVTDPYGRRVQFTYYGQGDPNGPAGTLKSITTPAVTGMPNQNNFPNGLTTAFTYTTGLSDPNLNGKLTSITYPKGNQVRIRYYTTNPQSANYGRVAMVWVIDDGPGSTFVYESSPTLAEMIHNDGNGHVVVSSFDDRNRHVQQREYTGKARPGEPVGDPNDPNDPNPLTGKLRPNDPLCFQTSWSYNGAALPTLIVYPNQNFVENRYGLELEPSAGPLSFHNLRKRDEYPGPLGGDQPVLHHYWEYMEQSGGCCGTSFPTLYVDPLGHETRYTYDPNNGNRLSKLPPDVNCCEYWEYSDPHGQVTAYIGPDNGSAFRRRDAYTYYSQNYPSSFGRLATQVIDVGNNNLTTHYDYDAYGNISAMTDPCGSTWEYLYNQLNQLVLETAPSTGGDRYQTIYYYDANGNLVRTDMLNVDDQGHTVGANPYFTGIMEYDVRNLLTCGCREVGTYNGSPGPPELPRCAAVPPSEFINYGYGYDAAGNRILELKGVAAEDPNSRNAVCTWYDERNLVFRTTQGWRDPNDASVPNDPHANRSTTQYDYDGNGNLARTLQGIEDPNAPRVTVNTYDGYNRVIATVDAMGNRTLYHYDPHGNLGGERAPGLLNEYATRVLGELVDVEGGAANVRLSETMFRYDNMDRAIQSDVAHFDPNGQTNIGDGMQTTTTEYAGTSQVRRVKNDNNHVTTTEYDTANRVRQVLDAKGNTVTYTYDACSKPVSITELDQPSIGGPDQEFVTTRAYDALHRLIRTEDNVHNATTLAYDSRNNQTRTVDARGTTTRMFFDGDNRLVETVRDPTGLDIGTQQEWDDSGRLVAQTDDNGHTTAYGHDALDRLTYEQHADGTMKLYQYDVHNNRFRVTEPNDPNVDIVVTCQYDLLNRLTRKDITFGPHSGVSPETTWEDYKYDGRSQLKEARDNDSTVTRSCDSLGNVLRETQNGRMVTRVFDAVGNKKSCTYPSGRVITRTYDELERVHFVQDPAHLSAVNFEYFYVGPERIQLRRDDTFQEFYQFDGFTGAATDPNDQGVKQIVRVKSSRRADPNVALDEHWYHWSPTQNKTWHHHDPAVPLEQWYGFTYDAAERLVHTVVTGWQPRDTTYVLDGVHNRKEVRGSPDPGLYTMNGADGAMNQYTTTPFDRRLYHKKGNLIECGGWLRGDVNCDGAVNFGDINAFVLALSDPDEYRRQYPDCHIMTADINGDGRVDFGDINPFVAELTIPTHVFRYRFYLAYNYRDELVVYRDLYENIWNRYAYDALGRRIWKAVNASGGAFPLTAFFYDDWQVIEEQDRAHMTQATYVCGPRSIDDVSSVQRGGRDYRYFHDDLGSITLVLDETGTPVERYLYGDFGQPTFYTGAGSFLANGSTIGNSYLFTGREYDAESRLYCYRARYLDSRAGRFVTRDPIGIWGDASNLGNPYTYVANNPCSSTDPMGLANKGCAYTCELKLPDVLKQRCYYYQIRTGPDEHAYVNYIQYEGRGKELQVCMFGDNNVRVSETKKMCTYTLDFQGGRCRYRYRGPDRGIFTASSPWMSLPSSKCEDRSWDASICQPHPGRLPLAIGVIAPAQRAVRHRAGIVAMKSGMSGARYVDIANNPLAQFFYGDYIFDPESRMWININFIAAIVVADY